MIKSLYIGCAKAIVLIPLIKISLCDIFHGLDPFRLNESSEETKFDGSTIHFYVYKFSPCFKHLATLYFNFSPLYHRLPDFYSFFPLLCFKMVCFLFNYTIYINNTFHLTNISSTFLFSSSYDLSSSFLHPIYSGCFDLIC